MTFSGKFVKVRGYSVNNFKKSLSNTFILGFGVISKNTFVKGQFLMELSGERVSRAEGEARDRKIK